MSAPPEKEGPASGDENGAEGLANLSKSYHQSREEQLVFTFWKEIAAPPHNLYGARRAAK